MAPPPEASDPVYVSGAATLRSAKHTMRYSKARKKDPGPVAPRGAFPAEVRATAVFGHDRSKHDMAPAVARLLRRAGAGVGSWPDPGRRGDLEDFVVPAESLRDSKAGSCDEAQSHLADMVATDEADGGLLPAFDAFVREHVLPWLKRRLVASGALSDEASETPTRVWYQRPPTLRLQPGPSTRYVKPHADADYGHQPGELNFWMPLTCQSRTGTTLWLESAPGVGDYVPLDISVGQVACFHGTSRRHHVPANSSECTRVSLDFRVGVGGYFDPAWSMKGTRADHGWREVAM